MRYFGGAGSAGSVPVCGSLALSGRGGALGGSRGVEGPVTTSKSNGEEFMRTSFGLGGRSTDGGNFAE